MTLTDLAFTSHGIRSAAWHAPARLVGRAGRTALCRHGQRLRRNPRHNRGFGASEGSPRQDISVRRQRQDYHAAVAAVRHLSGVDRNRVVLWGTSYSGGHCVAVAAKDGRIAAVVSMPPAMDGFATVLHLMRQGEIGLLLRATANGWRDWHTNRRSRALDALRLSGDAQNDGRHIMIARRVRWIRVAAEQS
jgi:uncharacterized protein